MFKDVLQHMQHATWYANAGLVIFIVVFVAVSIRAIASSERNVSQWSAIPLDDPREAGRRRGGTDELHR